MSLTQSPPEAAFGPIQISSISTAITASKANPINWVYVSSAGSGGLVVKDQGGTARTYSGLIVGDLISGPFTQLTSMTVAGLWYGSGPPPQNIAAATARASTTSALGGVKMSVAPASADSPTAVGTNDARVTTIDIPIALDGTDGSLAEQPIPYPPVTSTLTGARLIMAAAVTQDDTDFLTLTLAKRDGAGGAATTLVEATTEATGGINLLAFRAVTMGTPSVAAIVSTNILTFKSVVGGTGQASGPGVLRLSFTVP